MNQTTNKIIFVPYVRNSSEDEGRQVASLGEKEKVLMELAKRYGLKTAEAMREAHSAKTANMRPVFSEMVRKIKSGSDFGIVCCKEAKSNALRRHIVTIIPKKAHYYHSLSSAWLINIAEI